VVVCGDKFGPQPAEILERLGACIMEFSVLYVSLRLVKAVIFFLWVNETAAEAALLRNEMRPAI